MKRSKAAPAVDPAEKLRKQALVRVTRRRDRIKKAGGSELSLVLDKAATDDLAHIQKVTGLGVRAAVTEAFRIARTGVKPMKG